MTLYQPREAGPGGWEGQNGRIGGSLRWACGRTGPGKWWARTGPPRSYPNSPPEQPGGLHWAAQIHASEITGTDSSSLIEMAAMLHKEKRNNCPHFELCHSHLLSWSGHSTGQPASLSQPRLSRVFISGNNFRSHSADLKHGAESCALLFGPWIRTYIQAPGKHTVTY